MLQKAVSKPWSPGPVTVTLFGYKVFADVVKLRGGATGFGWALVSWLWLWFHGCGCSYKERKVDTDTHRGEGRVKAEVEVGVK